MSHVEEISRGMTAEEIMAAVNAGKRVFWKNMDYEVVKDRIGQFHVKCHHNNDCIGLTWMDGKTLNGDETDFFLETEIVR